MQYITLTCGYGPGISHAVARRFGLAGHRIVLVARSAQRLDSAVAALSAEGIQSQAFVADLSDP
jgi:NADP-dependent 3-hydroxy acid dehydrogenase YdfG